MKCPSCGAAKLVRDTRKMSYTYKAETTSIPKVTGDYCPFRLLAHQGIEGDRHCGGSDWPGHNLTLIEAEEIEAFCQLLGQPADPALSRRNIVTSGVRLNALVGRHFRIGDCRLFGVELCEPCGSVGRRLATPDHDAAAIVRY